MNDDPFVTKTWAELAAINVELKQARRNRPAHRWCADGTGCRHCRLIRDLHARADDHLYQLEGKDPDPFTEPSKLALYFHAPGVSGSPAAAQCGICGDVRYLMGTSLDVAVLMCQSCDEPAYTTEQLDMDEAE
jgi:hypothetical protein